MNKVPKASPVTVTDKGATTGATTDEGYLYEKYDKLDQKTRVFSDPKEIKRFDEEFWDVTKELPVRTGSLTRLSKDALRRWRIELTESNREYIRSAGEEFRAKDIREKENDSTIENIEATTASTLMENSMLRTMVHLATKMMLALDDGQREFRVLDLASGFGNASISLAASLWSDPANISLFERTRFHLVDLSNIKLLRAGQKLDDYERDPARIALTPQKDDTFLAKTEERFDIVFSLGHLHKKPFLLDTLQGIHGVLARKGVLISGDWHSAMPEHPFFIYKFFERAGLDQWRLKMFWDMFKGFMDPSSIPPLSVDEQRAVIDHQNYWANVHQEILHSPNAMAVKSRHYVLGAFDTTAKRLKTMEEANLVTDPEEDPQGLPEDEDPQQPGQDGRHERSGLGDNGHERQAEVMA